MPLPDTTLYPITIHHSKEDGGFIALAPDLPGCSAFGPTRGVAAIEIGTAITVMIDAIHQAGNPIPLPSSLPPTYSHETPSLGRATLNLSNDITIQFVLTSEMIKQSIGLDADQIQIMRAIIENALDVDLRGMTPEDIARLADRLPGAEEVA